MLATHATEDDTLRIVQFMHPRRESHPDLDGGKSWKESDNEASHSRTFVSAAGEYVRSVDASRTTSAPLHFWCEWECDAELVQRFPTDTDFGFPRVLFRPWFRPRKESELRKLRNTNPFVFGGPFRYCICQQQTKRTLRQLARGSVILFGSHRRGKFVLDTVFVVAESFPYNHNNYKSLNVPNVYRNAAIVQVVTGDGCSGGERFRLYEGATFHNDVNGMFSFFPRLPAEQSLKSDEFRRPALRETGPLNGRINPNLTQSVKMNREPVSLDQTAKVWRSVVDQVAANLCLGVTAKMPAVKSS